MIPALAVAAALVALLRCAGAARAQRLWSDPPFADPGGAVAPARENERGRTVASLLAASPYGIEDLSAWRLEIRADAGILESGLSWRRLAHPLYREDRVAGLIEARHSGVGVSCGVIPFVSLRAIEGFPGERSVALLATVSWEPWRFVSIRALVPAWGGRSGAGPGPAVRCSAFSGRVRGGVLVHSPDAIETEARLSAAIDLGSGAAIESSYAARAREVSSAFAVARRGFRVSIAWSVHPSLGVSASAEVGRAWSW